MYFVIYWFGIYIVITVIIASCG